MTVLFVIIFLFALGIFCIAKGIKMYKDSYRSPESPAAKRKDISNKQAYHHEHYHTNSYMPYADTYSSYDNNDDKDTHDDSSQDGDNDNDDYDNDCSDGDSSVDD